MGKRTLVRYASERSDAVAVKRVVTNAYQSDRSDHGVKVSFNLNNYSSRTQVLNTALENHRMTKEVLEVLNTKTWGTFVNNKGEAIKHETLQKHLSGMNTQGRHIHVTTRDGVKTTYRKGMFKANEYKLVSYHSIITIDGGQWVKRLK